MFFKIIKTEEQWNRDWRTTDDSNVSRYKQYNFYRREKSVTNAAKLFRLRRPCRKLLSNGWPTRWAGSCHKLSGSWTSAGTKTQLASCPTLWKLRWEEIFKIWIDKFQRSFKWHTLYWLLFNCQTILTHVQKSYTLTHIHTPTHIHAQSHTLSAIWVFC